MVLTEEEAEEFKLKIKDLRQNIPCIYNGNYRGYIILLNVSIIDYLIYYIIKCLYYKLFNILYY